MCTYIFKNSIKAVTGLLLKKRYSQEGYSSAGNMCFTKYYYNRSQNKKCLIISKLKPVFGYIEKKTKWGN